MELGNGLVSCEVEWKDVEIAAVVDFGRRLFKSGRRNVSGLI